ncbi:MAG TPA: hypothetical protein VEY14_01075 [Nocardioidaceae bacterium]|nr:hypothetical protein [Nocardioidaceae bacterium]
MTIPGVPVTRRRIVPDGVGARDLATGYTGYASLGQYTLRVPGDGCA